MKTAFQLGHDAVFECCNLGEPIPSVVATLDLKTANGLKAIEGVLDACLEIIGACLAAGHTLSGSGSEELNQYRSVNLLRIAHKSHNEKPRDESVQWNTLIYHAAESVRSQMIVTISSGETKQEDPKPLQVEVVSMPVPEKVPVEILSMPDRQTVTSLVRDGAGNLVSSTQLETDAKP